MKKIGWCVPLSFVTAVIFLLGNVSTSQAATVCEWGYISVGNNEYIRQLICYENGGEGREDVKYGTRPGSNNPRDGGGGGIGAAETYKTDTLKTDRRFCIRSNDTCDGWFLSATSRCGSIFQGAADALSCANGADQQRNDSCSALRAANTC